MADRSTPAAEPSASPYPVLAQYQPPSLTQQQQSQQPTAYPAVLASRARSVAPWELSPDEIEQMMAAGVPEAEIWAVPGRSVA